MLTTIRHALTDPMEATRYFVSTGVIGLTVLMLPVPVWAGQGSTNSQVSLRIVARPPAPKVTHQLISAASRGEPRHPMFKDWVTTQEKSGAKLVVITKEF